MSEINQYDYLVIGSGIAGLSFALKASLKGRVAILTKKRRKDSNTNYAQGGIAAVISPTDSFESHVSDTLEAGAGLCDEEVVQIIVEEGPDRVRELIALGMDFSLKDGAASEDPQPYDLGKEGGHSERRILHAKDMTGKDHIQFLCSFGKTTFLNNYFQNLK